MLSGEWLASPEIIPNVPATPPGSLRNPDSGNSIRCAVFDDVCGVMLGALRLLQGKPPGCSLTPTVARWNIGRSLTLCHCGG